MEIKHIYFINLDRRKDRHENIKAELQKINIPHTRISGVDLHPVFENAVARAGTIKRVIGIHGIYFSHLKALRQALATDTISNEDYFAVLEDDISIDDSLLKKLHGLILPEGYDMFFLDPFGKKTNKISPDQLYVEINGVWPEWGGAHFCIIQKRKIPKLIHMLTNYSICDIDNMYMRELKCCSIELGCVAQQVHVFGSDRL